MSSIRGLRSETGPHSRGESEGARERKESGEEREMLRPERPGAREGNRNGHKTEARGDDGTRVRREGRVF